MTVSPTAIFSFCCCALGDALAASLPAAPGSCTPLFSPASARRLQPAAPYIVINHNEAPRNAAVNHVFGEEEHQEEHQ